MSYQGPVKLVNEGLGATFRAIKPLSIAVGVVQEGATPITFYQVVRS